MKRFLLLFALPTIVLIGCGIGFLILKVLLFYEVGYYDVMDWFDRVATTQPCRECTQKKHATVEENGGKTLDKEVEGELGNAAQTEKLYREGTLKERGAKERLAFLEECVERFGGDPDPDVRLWAVKAYYEKWLLTWQSSKPENYHELLNTFSGRFQNDGDLRIRELVFKALFERAKNYNQDVVLATYDACIKHFHEDPSPLIRARVGEVFLRKGIAVRAWHNISWDSKRVWEVLAIDVRKIK